MILAPVNSATSSSGSSSDGGHVSIYSGSFDQNETMEENFNPKLHKSKNYLDNFNQKEKKGKVLDETDEIAEGDDLKEKA